jgi:hypothetical protein
MTRAEDSRLRKRIFALGTRPLICLGGFQPVQPRQANVEENQIRLELLCLLNRVLPIGRFTDDAKFRPLLKF